MADTQIPVAHLFTITTKGAPEGRYDYVGPFGRRIFEKSRGGTVTGERFNGTVLDLHANDYGRASPDGTIRHFEADVGLQADDGTVVLMQYRGRSSPKYGNGQSRIQMLFDVEEGPHEWLNTLQAIGYGVSKPDGSTTFEIYELIEGEPIEGPEANQNINPMERTSVPADFILRRKSEHLPGGTRHTVMSPLGARYFTLAETGGVFHGPRVGGKFLAGYSWSPHYMRSKGEPGSPDFKMLMHFNVRTLLRENDGTPILMSYTGASLSGNKPEPYMTGTLFEVPEDSPHAWLNEVQAIGFGRWLGDGAEYRVYGLR
jgi:Protein of unknown function (DUF3237)